MRLDPCESCHLATDSPNLPAEPTWKDKSSSPSMTWRLGNAPAETAEHARDLRQAAGRQNIEINPFVPHTTNALWPFSCCSWVPRRSHSYQSCAVDDKRRRQALKARSIRKQTGWCRALVRTTLDWSVVRRRNCTIFALSYSIGDATT